MMQLCESFELGKRVPSRLDLKPGANCLRTGRDAKLHEQPLHNLPGCCVGRVELKSQSRMGQGLGVLAVAHEQLA
jgi:hypothetical protein